MDGPSQSASVFGDPETSNSSQLQATTNNPTSSNDLGSEGNSIEKARKPITIQIGERSFTTTQKTLTAGGGYLAAQFSGRWAKETHGSYFLDLDGNVFEHILRYLRSLADDWPIYPIFYDQAKGHDYDLYQHVMAQAHFLALIDLANWIEEKKYIDAIVVRRTATVFDEIGDIRNKVEASNVKVEYYPTFKTKKVYLCPRRIDVHRGEPNRCGQACARARNGAEDEYGEEEELKVFEVRSEIEHIPSSP